MGGGRQMLKTNTTGTKYDPIDTWAGHRQDGKDLIEEWKRDKSSRGLAFSVVQNNEELSRVNVDKVDYLLGIFANGHISMDWNREKGPKGQPSLEDMTVTALKILQKSKDGYLLVVYLHFTKKKKSCINWIYQVIIFRSREDLLIMLIIVVTLLKHY